MEEGVSAYTIRLLDVVIDSLILCLLRPKPEEPMDGFYGVVPCLGSYLAVVDTRVQSITSLSARYRMHFGHSILTYISSISEDQALHDTIQKGVTDSNPRVADCFKRFSEIFLAYTNVDTSYAELRHGKSHWLRKP